jgi:trehalose/maltose transport system substrate-binding protein
MRDRNKVADENIGITGVLGAKGVPAATLGGFGLGIPRSAPHPAEALELVKFLVRREIKFEQDRLHAKPTERRELNNWPTILQMHTDPTGVEQHKLVSRPSTVAGQRYEDVDHAFIKAVHSVLTGQTGAAEVAARLEKELIGITGLKTGPPSRIGGLKDSSTVLVH